MPLETRFRDSLAQNFLRVQHICTNGARTASLDLQTDRRRLASWAFHRDLAWHGDWNCESFTPARRERVRASCLASPSVLAVEWRVPAASGSGRKHHGDIGSEKRSLECLELHLAASRDVIRVLPG